jgi:hypothetical protein
MGEMRVVYNFFLSENLKGKDNSEGLDVDERKLECIFGNRMGRGSQPPGSIKGG